MIVTHRLGRLSHIEMHVMKMGRFVTKRATKEIVSAAAKRQDRSAPTNQRSVRIYGTSAQFIMEERR